MFHAIDVVPPCCGNVVGHFDIVWRAVALVLEVESQTRPEMMQTYAKISDYFGLVGDVTASAASSWTMAC